MQEIYTFCSFYLKAGGGEVKKELLHIADDLRAGPISPEPQTPRQIGPEPGHSSELQAVKAGQREGLGWNGKRPEGAPRGESKL